MNILSRYLRTIRSYSDVSLCFIESVFRNLIVVARKQGHKVTCTLVHTHVYWQITKGELREKQSKRTKDKQAIALKKKRWDCIMQLIFDIFQIFFQKKIRCFPPI